MVLNNSAILPFSDWNFYWIAAAAVVITYLLKLFLPDRNYGVYRYWLLLLGLLYCAFLFTNPIGILGFVIYSYGIYYWLSHGKERSRGFVVLLYTLPLLLNKFLHVFPDLKTDLRVVLQIAGISYMTFKMLQIHFDERQSERIKIYDYANFLLFPPTLLIGPIDRYRRFQDNVSQGFSVINQEQLSIGMTFLAQGILYKYIIAAAVQSLILNHIEGLPFMTYHLIQMYSYLIYLFFDFAGYSLLAMGLGNMLGVVVPFNFDRPFLAINPKEFWQRWHKSLGDWLNDYFFKPILRYLTFKNVFTPVARQSIALFLTFTLMGFWNGFELHYIASGMLFGLYSVIHNYYQIQCKKKKRDVFFGSMKPALVKYLSVFIMFNLVAISIYIFSGKLF